MDLGRGRAELARSLELDFIITVDRSMMSNHRGKEFLGFMTTAPAVGLPEVLWRALAMPRIPVDEHGRPRQAPYGLRKIEAALLDAGFSAAVVDPDHVRRYVERAKAVLIGHHDYFAFNSPSIEYWLITGEEPLNRRSFLEFASRLVEMKRGLNPDLKIIVGGPAAWQWLYVPEYIERFEVDTIVEGEAEGVVVELARRVTEGLPLPKFVMVGPRDCPEMEEVPVIRGASINGLVEIMRGCPRGCKFCSVTLRRLRHYPLEKIEQEMRVNASSGLKGCVLHSEDVLLYGAKGIEPSPDSVIKLHELAKRYHEEVVWSHATLSSVLYAERKYRLVSRVAELVLDGRQRYSGFQTGIETGSPRLARQIMAGKASPFKPEQWPDVVEEAFGILHDNLFVPAATLILGLPGETEDDVIRTIELVERLKDYRSLVVPMFFVPMGALRGCGWFTSVHLRRVHAELLLVCLKHSLFWAKDIVSRFYARGLSSPFLKLTLMSFLMSAERFARSLTPDEVLEHIERSRRKLAGEVEETSIRESVLERLRRYARAPKVAARP
ncbi:MAG: radical SAM protein [Fervidicoccaceae archaeon]